MNLVLRSIKILVLLTIISLGIGALAYAENIGITPNQRQQLRALAGDTRDKTRQERKSLMDARKDLFQAYQSYKLDDRKVNDTLERVNTSQKALLDIHLKSQLDIRSILNKDQFNEFQDKMKIQRGSRFMMEQQEGIERHPNKDIFSKLRLAPNQRQKLNKPEPRGDKVNEKLRRETKQMMNLFADYDIDAAAARKLVDSIHQSQVELTRLNHKKQQQLRSILNEQQFEQLKKETTKRNRDMKRARLDIPWKNQGE